MPTLSLKELMSSTQDSRTSQKFVLTIYEASHIFVNVFNELGNQESLKLNIAFILLDDIVPHIKNITSSREGETPY